MIVHRITRTAVLGLTLAALAAPAAAQAAQDLRNPDRRDSPQAVAGGQDLRNPDRRDSAQAVAGGQDLRSPDSRDAAAGRGTHTAPQVTVVRLSPDSEPVSGGLDWTDAAIGAGAGLALVLLGLTGVVAIAHRRQPAVPPTVTG
jgi:hypothetical protein